MAPCMTLSEPRSSASSLTLMECTGAANARCEAYIYRKHVSHTNSFCNFPSRDTWTRMITSQPRRSLSAWTCFLPLKRRWRAAWVVKAWSWFFLLIMQPITEPQGRFHQQQIAVVRSAMVQKHSGSTLIVFGSLCYNYASRCAPFFRLMKCRLNSVYDVHHCNNHVLANRVSHCLWFWTRPNLPEEYTVRLKTILEKHFTRFPYYPPFKEAIGKRD